MSPNRVRSSQSIPGGVIRMPAKAASTGIMHSRLTIPRRPLSRSESQPISRVLKMPANSRIAVLWPPWASVARLTSFR